MKKRLSILIILSLFSISLLIAQAKIDSLKSILNFHPDNPEKIKLYNQISEKLLYKDPEQAIVYANLALVLSEKHQDDKGCLKANKHIGFAKVQQGLHYESINYFELALSLAKKIGDLSLQGKISNNIGTSYTYLYNYPKALVFLKQSLAIKEKLNDRKGIANTLNNIGLNYSKINDYENAMFYYLKALVLRKTLNDPKTLASSYINLASIYFHLKNFKEALNHYNQSLQILAATDFNLKKLFAYHGKGEALIALKEYSKAKQIFDKALQITEQINHSKFRGKFLNSLAHIQLAKKNDLYAIRLFEQVLEISDTTVEKAYALLNLGNTNFKLNHHRLAEKYYQQSWQLAEILEKEDLLMKIAFRKAIFYEHKKNYKKALSQYKNYQKLQDSLLQKTNHNRILELQTRYETEEKETRIAQLIKVQSKNRENLDWALGGILVFSLCLCLAFYRQKQLKSKNSFIQSQQRETHQREKILLEEEIFQRKEKQMLQSKILTNKTIHMLEQNKLLEKIKTQLITIKKYLDKKSQLKIQSIISDLNFYNSQETWKSFEKHFLGVNQNFYSNLTEQFPNLSPNEKKLCAYLRLNMNSKEIATLLHISPKSVEVARSRLRKKLQLTNKNLSLNQFLVNF